MKKLSRREFLRASLIVGGAIVLNGCKPEATAVPTEAPPPGGDVPELDLPFEISPDAISVNLPPGNSEVLRSNGILNCIKG